MTSESGNIFLKYSDDRLIEESSSESDIRYYESESNQNDVNKLITLQDNVNYKDQIEENDLSSEITYQVEKDENDEKILKLKIELVMDDNSNKLFTLNLNINKKTYLEMGKDLLKD